MNLGRRGMLFLDVRYAADFGDVVRADNRTLYKRGMVSTTAGYRLGFFKRNGK
jgi:hypothetical protein